MNLLLQNIASGSRCMLLKSRDASRSDTNHTKKKSINQQNSTGTAKYNSQFFLSQCFVIHIKQTAKIKNLPSRPSIHPSSSYPASSSCQIKSLLSDSAISVLRNIAIFFTQSLYPAQMLKRIAKNVANMVR